MSFFKPPKVATIERMMIKKSPMAINEIFQSIMNMNTRAKMVVNTAEIKATGIPCTWSPIIWVSEVTLVKISPIFLLE